MCWCCCVAFVFVRKYLDDRLEGRNHSGQFKSTKSSANIGFFSLSIIIIIITNVLFYSYKYLSKFIPILLSSSTISFLKVLYRTGLLNHTVDAKLWFYVCQLLCEREEKPANAFESDIINPNGVVGNCYHFVTIRICAVAHQ